MAKTVVSQTSSGSLAFDQFRDGLASDTGARAELESALRVNVDRVNPSDPGNRFVTGGATEWILAAAAWALGVLTMPAGHSARGFDLVDLQDRARGLWSVKSSTVADTKPFRISNGLGGGGRGLADPTIFLRPKRLPGLVFVDPATHHEIVDAQINSSDSVQLPFRTLRDHVDHHPECVAPLDVPENAGHGRENPFLQYTQTILTPDRFPRLSRMFVAAQPARGSIADELARLAAMREADSLDDTQYRAAVEAVVRKG